MTADRPSTILDVPYLMSEYAPNTFTSGKYVGIVAILPITGLPDSMTVEIQRLIELYAATNQVGFIGRLRVDGMPVLSTASPESRSAKPQKGELERCLNFQVHGYFQHPHHRTTTDILTCEVDNGRL